MVTLIDLNFQNIANTIGTFLIKSATKNILIESGPYSTIENLQHSLLLLGLSIEDIHYIFLTHIHLDHAGAAWAFAKNGTQIYVHPKGQDHLIQPERLWNSAKMIYGDNMEVLWGRMEPINPELIHTVDDGEAIAIDDLTFQAIHTPGHANHHIAWKEGENLFTGDVAGVKIGNGPVAAPCPPPDINMEEWLVSLDKITDLNVSKLYLTHIGEILNVKDHIEALKHTLADYTTWIKPYYENKILVEEIIPAFQLFIKKELQAHGLSEEQVIQYETANPSWMSVSGLLRYWKKKSTF